MSYLKHHVEIETLLEPALGALGYELIGCEVQQQRHRSLLRVYIDKRDGITLDDCENASRQIGLLPELDALFKEAFTLEVSSPGLDRPLFKLEHFQKFLGEKVQIRLYSPLNGQRNFSGKLISANEEKVVLSINEKKDIEFRFDQIEKAKLVPNYEF